MSFLRILFFKFYCVSILSYKNYISFSVDYANDSLFVVNGPDVRNRDVAGYIFDINSGEVSGKFGTFLDPHDIAVTPDAREVITCFFLLFEL